MNTAVAAAGSWGAPEPRWWPHWRDLFAWFAYVWVLLILAGALKHTGLRPGHAELLLTLGAIGIWRYSLGIVHFVRALLFLYGDFPQLRRAAEALGDAGLPPHVYFLVTSFRIESRTTAAVYRSVIAEAGRCGRPATLVASIVEFADEQLIRALWQRLDPPDTVTLRVVRIPGTGKRDGLAHGFRTISRDMPDPASVVVVVDGDTVLHPGAVRRTAPYLKLLPKVGALTTNEFCQVEGSAIMREWHRLRFAQRHLNMCSMALTRRVLTLTGRMSVFRAEVVTRPEFINDVENDHLEHWRLGRFKFLTGDDKSSWYSLMRLGYDTFYVPDAAIDTLEHPPHRSFFVASRQLMFRWYGNSLRQNSRATGLGPGRLGWFTYYVLWDQRAGMWTSLIGITAATIASFEYGPVVLMAYFVWVLASRLYMTALLIASGHRLSPAYPLLLYYNQIVGSLIKIYVFFHLDQQSWTRQKTVLRRELDAFQRRFNRWSSDALMVSAMCAFVALVYHWI